MMKCVQKHVTMIDWGNGKVSLILLTAQAGSTTLMFLPSEPKHHLVSWRYSVPVFPRKTRTKHHLYIIFE